jgi:hypothetical protein
MSFKIAAILPFILFSQHLFAQACSASVTCDNQTSASCSVMSDSSFALDGIGNAFKVGICGTATDNKSKYCQNTYYSVATGKVASTYRYYICCTAEGQAVTLPVDAVAGAVLGICDHI